MLNQEPTKIETDPRKYMTLVYGIAGVGKTTFCSQIPDHYFLITEPGTEGVEVYGSVVQSWEDFLRLGEELIKAKQEDFAGQRRIEVIVIDTYEALYKMAGEWICMHETFLVRGRAQHFNKIEDVPWALGYRRTSELVLEKLLKLKRMGYGIFLTSHAKERTVTWRGEEVSHFGPNLSQASAEALVNACGAVGFFTMEQEVERTEEKKIVRESRWMYWQPQFMRVAKHRLAGFPEKLPLPLNGWEVYVNAFKETLSKERGDAAR